MLYTVVQYFFTIGKFHIDYFFAWVLFKDMNRPRKVIYCVLWLLSLEYLAFQVSLKTLQLNNYFSQSLDPLLPFFQNGSFEHLFLIMILVVKHCSTVQIYAYQGVQLLVKNLCVMVDHVQLQSLYLTGFTGPSLLGLHTWGLQGGPF